MTDHWTPDTIKGWRIWVWPQIPDGGQTTEGSSSRRTVENSLPTRQLQSMTIRGFEWRPEMPPASCDPTNFWPFHLEQTHDSPDRQCGCGYYSIKPDLLAEPRKWGQTIWDLRPILEHAVIGWIESWGVVDEYELGYRASHARITSFIELPWSWIQRHHCWYVEDGALRNMWQEEAHDKYQTRLGEVAQAYDLPVVSIEDSLDTPSVSQYTQGSNPEKG